MKIITARSHYKYRSADEYTRWLRDLALRTGQDGQKIMPHQLVDDKAVPAIAYVNHGRWVADCPTGCGGAMLVEPDMPFVCGNCFNAELHGKWRAVLWPDDKAGIETELEKRPLPHTANWLPGETVADLRRENREHGLGEGVA